MHPHIPSPDAFVMGLYDRAGQALQRRGLILPTVRSPIPFVEVVALGLITLVIGHVVEAPYLILATVMACVQTVVGIVGVLRLRLDARDWTPETIARYGDDARWTRVNAVHRRGVCLVTTLVFAALTGTLLLRTGLGLGTGASACMLLWSFGRMTDAYAECVLPLR